MQHVRVEEASPQDIPEIRSLAVLVWNQHYPSIISREQIGYMLDLMYSEESLASQMNEKQHRFCFIVEGDHRAGFVSFQRETETELFINKFYIDQNKAGAGIGSAAFALLVKLNNPQTIRLTVNRQNIRAINFYFRNGFRIERVADFDIGNGFVMNDFVMIWHRNQGAGMIGGQPKVAQDSD